MNSTIHTKYSNLETDELLTLLDERRHQSPIINELCLRLEQNPPVIANNNAECPICEGNLFVDIDHSNEFYIVKPRND